MTLTGCLRRGTQEGTFILSSVATAGVVNGGEQAQRELPRDVGGQEKSAPDTSTDTSRAQLAGASSYQLMTTEDEHLERYENKRVVVRGRLAAEAPVGTSGTAPTGGRTVDSSATNATIQGSAPPLRGLQVQSVKVVADTCSGTGK